MADLDVVEAKRAALAEIADDPKLAPILDYWHRAAGEGGLPRPCDIDPITLPPSILPYLTLLDVVDGGASFRIRLVGTASASAIGRDYTGQDLATAMSGDVLVATLDRYRAAITHQRPILASAEYAMPDGTSVKNLLMTLPLSSDGVGIDRLLGVFSPRSEWLAQQSLRGLDYLAYRKPARSYVIL